MKRALTRVAVAALLLGGSGWLIAKFVITPFVVVGDSMEPTLRSLDLCLMQRVRPYPPARGDIVMFRTADDPPVRFVKRVIALPGDILAITRGVVSINGVVLAEPYAPLNPDLELPATNVPPDKVYVMGDNRSDTLRTFVAIRLVQGRLRWHWRWKPERISS